MYVDLALHEQDHDESLMEDSFVEAPELEDGLNVQPHGGAAHMQVPPPAPTQRITLIGSTFRKRGADGDYAIMIRDEENYPKTLFIFNDSAEEHSLTYKVIGGTSRQPKSGVLQSELELHTQFS